MQLEESKKASEKKMKKDRRTFLKRAVYTAPSLIILGSLARPVAAVGASGECGGVLQPPCPPVK